MTARALLATCLAARAAAGAGPSDEFGLRGGHVGDGDAGIESTDVVDSTWQCTRRAPVQLNLTAALGRPDLPAFAHVARSGSRLRGRAAKYGKGKYQTDDVRALHRIAAAMRPLASGETGFGSGTSTLAVLSALPPSSVHIAIDPFQGAFREQGYRAATAYAARAGVGRFVHLNETASLGLAWLHKRRQCFDLFWMDDGHKFDDNIVELYHVAKALSIGGVLIIHDSWLGSVAKTARWIGANLRFLKVLGGGGLRPGGGARGRAPSTARLLIAVKTAADVRKWDHFQDF